MGCWSACFWSLAVSAAGAAPAKAPTAGPFATLVDLDVVGTHPTALVTPEAWAALHAAAPTLAAADQGADAVALASRSRPKARRAVEIDLGAEGPSTLLFGWQGEAPGGAPLVRLTVSGAGGTHTVDLRPADVPAMGRARIDTDVAIVDAGGGRTLAVVWPGVGRTLEVEARQPGAEVVLLGAASGELLRPTVGPARSLEGGFPFPFDLDTPAPPVPAAWKVPPRAGSRGKVTVRDGHLAFADGTRARFWGINLLNAANYPTHEVADRLAAQLADHGFNLVRLHHADALRAGGVNPDRKSPSDPLFRDEGLDRLDYLVSRLEAAGLYVLLETATFRTFTAADGVSGPFEDVPNGHKLLSIFEPTWRAAYLDWARAWLGRTNRYTGLRYADDPGVAMVELANEHVLTSVWLTGTVEKLPRAHRLTLDRQWNEFLRGRYPDDAALAAAWSGSVNPGLLPGETLGAVARAPSGQGTFGQWPPARVGDLHDFYTSLDAAFYADVAQVVRSLGYTQPLVPGVTYDLPVVARLFSRYDVVDLHMEWDYPAGSFRNEGLVQDPRGQGVVEKLRVAQVGKPMIVSELGAAFPSDHMAEAPLLWASLAAIQDWDALVWLNYTNGPIDAGPGPVGSPTETRFAATKMGQMAVASGWFRSGAVTPAVGLSPQWRDDATLRAEVVSGARPSLPETRDVSVPLSTRIREQYGGTPALPIPGRPSTQLGWWPAGGRFVIQTDALEAVLGDHFLRGRVGRGEGSGPTSAAHLDAELDGPAAVSLVCLDGAVATCKRGLLTIAGQMENVGTRRVGSGTVIVDDGGEAVVLGRPAGRVRFAWPRQPVVRPIDADGKVGAPVPVSADGAGWWAVPMESAGPTMWWSVG